MADFAHPSSTVYAVARRNEHVALFRRDEQGNSHRIWPEASLKLINHSPTGFEFGYLGSGPQQLALTILLDFSGDAELARRHYHTFAQRYVQRWQGCKAEIAAAALADFLVTQELDDAAFERQEGEPATAAPVMCSSKIGRATQPR